jgi:hypothetical protein
MNSEAIVSSIDSLKAVYTVLLALSLGEAFSQLVKSSPTKAERVIQWDRALNLVPFLLLIIPFIQGMDRYFFVVYKTTSRPISYGGHLLGDCIVFTLEGSLFFVLARSLSKDRWQRFYGTVISLLALDAVWGLTVFWRFHPPAVLSWIILDALTLVLISAVCFFRAKNPNNSTWKPTCCLLIILVRTILDYILSWNFYFPPS